MKRTTRQLIKCFHARFNEQHKHRGEEIVLRRDLANRLRSARKRDERLGKPQRLGQYIRENGFRFI